MAKHARKKQAVQPVRHPAIATGAAPAVASPEPDLRLGLAAFQRGNYAEAIQAWQRARRAGAATSVDRALAEAHFRRALGAPNPIHRVAGLQEATVLVPDRAIYHFHLGLTHHRQGQLRRAVAAYEQALQLSPGDERINCHLALALLADPTTIGRARELFGQLSARMPKVGEAVIRLRALADLGEKDPASALALLAARKAPSPLVNLALGVAYLAAGQTESAREALGKAQRARRPISAEARQAAALGIAVSALRDGRLDEAQKVLGSHGVPGDASLRPAFATILRRLAVEQVLDERLPEAIHSLEQALAAQPGHTLTQNSRWHLLEVAGTRAARHGNFVDAAHYWETALAGQPSNPRLLRNLALAEERLERWTAASGRWEELIRLWKKDGQTTAPGGADDARHRLGVAHRHLAGTHEAAGNLHAAARALERALTVDPSDVAMRLRAAELYLENEEYGNAIEQLRRIREARPEDTRVLLDLGSAYDLKGDDRQAQSYLEQALALEPKNQAVKSTLASVHHGRAHRLESSKQNERAVAEFQRAIELAPADPANYECLGALLLTLDRPDAAAPALQRVIALQPADAKARLRIAGIYLTHDRAPEAERLFREALRLDGSVLTHGAIGLIYALHGDLTEAEPHFKHVLKGHEPALLVRVGEALMGAGRLEEAVPYLERAISLAPMDVEARLTLAYIYAIGRRDYARAGELIGTAEAMANLSGDPALRRLITTARQTNELLTEEADLLKGGI